jgi:hypothetical protein
MTNVVETKKQATNIIHDNKSIDKDLNIDRQRMETQPERERRQMLIDLEEYELTHSSVSSSSSSPPQPPCCNGSSHIIIKKLDGQKKSMKIDLSSCTIKQLRLCVAVQAHISSHELRFVRRGSPLSDTPEVTLDQLHIANGDTIHLIKQMYGS